MMGTLKIHWDRNNPKIEEPYVEIFRGIKDEKKAMKILGKRRRDNIEMALFDNQIIFVQEKITQKIEELVEEYDKKEETITEEIVEPSEDNTSVKSEYDGNL